MGIRVQKGKEGVAGAWTWRRDTNFPQQNNGVDCGMVAIVTTTHLAQRWQLPVMHETVMNKYLHWLLKVIIDDSEDHFEVQCPQVVVHTTHNRPALVNLRACC